MRLRDLLSVIQYDQKISITAKGNGRVIYHGIAGEFNPIMDSKRYVTRVYATKFFGTLAIEVL